LAVKRLRAVLARLGGSRPEGPFVIFDGRMATEEADLISSLLLRNEL